MIIVTGGAGFIGSNIVKGLNERGRDDILIVDNLTNMVKFKNIQGLKALDYMDKIDFAEALKAGKFNHEKIDVIFHEGACSDTMEYNGKYMMQNNFEYTKNLMHFAADRKIQMIYASSASTYGSGAHGFTEKPECEEALNVYAFSKLFFDNYARRYFGKPAASLLACVTLTFTVRRKTTKAKWRPWYFRCTTSGKPKARLNCLKASTATATANRPVTSFM